MSTLQDKENEWTFMGLIDTAAKAVGINMDEVKLIPSKKTYGELTPTEQDAYDTEIANEAFAAQEGKNMVYEGNVEKLDEHTPSIKMDSQSQFKPMTSAEEGSWIDYLPALPKQSSEEPSYAPAHRGSVNVKYNPQISTLGMGSPSALQSAITSKNKQKLGLYKEKSNKEFL